MDRSGDEPDDRICVPGTLSVRTGEPMFPRWSLRGIQGKKQQRVQRKEVQQAKRSMLVRSRGRHGADGLACSMPGIICPWLKEANLI